jgi:uncharacterized membrane protein
MLESAWLANWLVVGFFLIAGVAVKVVDLKRKRTADAAHLEAVISDALLRETALSGLVITPTVHVRFWRGSPVTITVSGTVPAPGRRETVIRVVRGAASRIRSDFAIDDRLALSPPARVAS